MFNNIQDIKRMFKRNRKMPGNFFFLEKHEMQKFSNCDKTQNVTQLKLKQNQR